MKQRKLGKNGPMLTTLGCGTWAIGGAGWAGSWGSQDDETSITAIRAALDSGVNWFDTAAAYGLGHSEEVLSRALGEHRHDVFIATKFGLVWDEKGNLTNLASYDSIMRECDASLKRLRVDHIDLYQMHWPDTVGTPVEESMRALHDLVKAGKIRFVGVSNFDLPLLKRALTVCHVDSLQPPYSLFFREVEQEILPFCQEKGIGVVAYSPLASGLLGGKYTMETTFEDGDWRAHDPRYSGEGLRRNLEIVERLRAIGERRNMSVAQLAIAWVLSNPAVTSAIIGVRKPEHITSVLTAADAHLDEQARQEIEEAMTGDPVSSGR